ncbi:Oxyanion-translocating ATPase [Halanaeroarchaeum sp. HSR-CO]|uniref:ArsA family ATPase n=1 Tax=Halanaeroarchaeum sp. HSR-CO TaxID=2866382 RepID=UPI00217E57DE|nr:arsenical pump-driving ATPase GET3 [Halanaeroarchaeum sp. HSR-CO]UWG47304.1 Oxyanion-translocating ATPase [Halanaeroarchaeum sp. HSR-CO]
MDELTVEAVDSLEPALDAETAEYVLYGGKGGVGKTTMAAATALASATDGTSTLVVSTDPAHSLSDTLGVDIPDEPTRLREDVPLYGVEIDPDKAMDEAPIFGDDGSAMGPLGDLLGDEGFDPMMGGQMPGADEAAAMQLLLTYLDDQRFDRVVVDTAPTGHTLRLLELPELLDSMVGRFVALRERLGGLMEGVKGMFGEEAPAEGDGMDDLDELADRVERLRAILRDPQRTDFRIVTVPEEMAVQESLRLRSRLEEFGIPVGTVVVNRVMEPLSQVTDDVPEETFVSPDLEHCEFCQRRWAVQQGALQSAQDLFRGHDVKRVPLFADEVAGERMLRVVAACLQ